MLIRSAVLFLFLIPVAACQKQASFFDARQMHYQVKMEMDPAGQFLRVDGSLYIPGLDDGLTEMTFYLHRQLKINELKGPGIIGFTVDSLTPTGYAWLPDAKMVHVQLDRKGSTGKALELFFSYEGHLTKWAAYSANAFTAEWVELGLYFPWYLHSIDLRSFTYQIEVQCPDNYRISGLHEVAPADEGWLLSAEVPVNDMVILASPSLRSFSEDSGGLRVIFDYVSLSDTLVGRMTADIQEIADWMVGQFGPVPFKSVHIVQSPRAAGGGYARVGGVVLGGLQESNYHLYHTGYQRYFAHEIAHLWWRHAPTSNWHDWINEAFAEYSALMLLREVFGRELYQRYVDTKRSKLKGTPPMWEFDRHDRSDPGRGDLIELMLYSKGPVLLADLEAKAGIRAFLSLCRHLLLFDTIDTGQLLTSISAVLSDSLSEQFRQTLMTF
ncbi:MAG: hypothetical protein R6V75_04505 [Bacteroidales bacterium]